MDFKDFFQIINYQFQNLELLKEALIHPSATKNNDNKNYQRFEFLGDKVLSLVISNYLINKYKDENEGELSRRHAFLVSGLVLSQIAFVIEIDKYLILSSGEEGSGGRNRKSNLENALEALIGAIYLDSGFEECEKFILKFWQDFLEKHSSAPKDPVSELQEYVQLKSKKLPEYEIVKSGGSDHDPEFEAIVKIDYCDLEIKAIGSSKKEAQKKAAGLALQEIKKGLA